MRKTYTWLIILMLLITGIYADVTITGDARVRPRLDIKDNGEFGNKTSDMYYLYRARLKVAADIGDGYFFKTMLASNGVAWWTGKFGTGATPNAASQPGAGRGSVNFMELYFGQVGETFGWSAGIIPVAGTPLKDLHFYPTKMVDLPYLIFNNNSAHGFDFNYKLAGNKLDLKILVDNNDGLSTLNSEGESIDNFSVSYSVNPSSGAIEADTNYAAGQDQYTFDASYPVKFAGIKIVPEVLFTVADEGRAAPMTYGAEIGLPKVAGFGVSAFAGLTNQSVEDAGKYNGWIARAKFVGKVGPGALTAWYDIAATTYDVGDVTNNFSYLWLSYTYTLHKSDKGAVTLAPTYRLVSHKIDDVKDYSRAKLELTTQITFK